VLQNVAYGLQVQGKPDAECQRTAGAWIARVGLEGYENHYPAQLSGGMQQRVGLARALATDADILLMDEAFSALDPLIRTEMQGILLELQSELNKTIVFITHDLDEALRLGDNIAILRDGAVIQQGSAQQIVLKPADGYIRDFIKDINRGRVIRLGSLVEGPAPSGPALAHDLLLEDALLHLSDAPDQRAAVVDKSGKVMGGVDLKSAIRAIHA
jgi:glycine betaine/proline transport system ATP-binding protein